MGRRACFNKADRLPNPLGVRQAPLDPPGPLFEKGRRVVVGVSLHILGQRQGDGSGLYRIGQHPHGLRQGRQELLGPGDAVEETTDGAKAVIHADIGRYRMLELLQDRTLVPGHVVVRRQEQYRQSIDGGRSRPRQHVGGPRTDGGGAGQGGQAAVRLGVSRSRVHHGLFVAGLKVGEVGPVFVKRLPQTSHVAMAEDAEDGRDQAAGPSVAHTELHLKVFHQGLCDSQPNRLLRTLFEHHPHLPFSVWNTPVSPLMSRPVKWDGSAAR